MLIFNVNLFCLGEAFNFPTIDNILVLISLLAKPTATLVLFPLKPYGPHIFPKFLTKPIRVYTPNLDINLVGRENKNCTVIYQWVNLINGKIYIGSAWKGSERLLSYWRASTLKRNFPIYRSITYYTHNNFALAILEDLGKTGSVTKELMLSREQHYLDIIFKFDKEIIMNNS